MASPQPVFSARRVRRFAIVIVAIAAVAFAANEALHWYRHVYEPNARVEADFTTLSSSVNGRIARIEVERGDRVTEGQRLASMDTAEAELEVLSLQADLAKEQAVRREAEEELGAFLRDLDNRIATATEGVRQLQRQLGTLDERWRIARTNVERNSQLANQSMIARQRIDDANDKLLEITSKRRDVQTSIGVQEKQLAELEGTRAQESVFQSRIEVIDRTIDKIAVGLDRARHRLHDMHIYSPVDAVINDVLVNPGAYVEDGDPVFLIHDPARLWIEAAVDESDIRHVRVGQPVVIDFEAYPFEEFEGTVRRIGEVTTAHLGAPDTARSARSGSETIPVIIDFSPLERPVWPGMRVAVNIVIR